MWSRPCPCGSELPSEWQYDAQGIELCRTCEDCHDVLMGKFRQEIITGYTQADVDEPIEPD